MSEHSGLLATVSTARLQRYTTEAVSQGVDVADLYLWNLEVSQALFQDLSVVEIGLRNAMSEQLLNVFGPQWFRSQVLFDDDTMRLISQAWAQGRLDPLVAPEKVVHGKLVASFMFGFWVKLLGRGSHHGRKDPWSRPPFKTRRVYDELLWKPCLRGAFPNVSDTQRTLVEKASRDVQSVRNRVAHHEAVIWGIPLPGQRDSAGQDRRLSVSESHEAMIRLAGYIDVSLANWLRTHSSLPKSLAACPLADPSVLRI